MSKLVPCFLLDHQCDPSAKLSDLGQVGFSGGLPYILSVFDAVAHIKERITLNSLYSKESMRRIVFFDSNADHSFLVEKDLVFSQSFMGNKKLIDAALEMQKSFRMVHAPTDPGPITARYEGPKDRKLAAEIGFGFPLGEKKDVFFPDQITSALSEEHLCLSIEFLDGLTVPPKNTPLDDILNFKERRQSEYQDFWNCLFEIAADIEYFNSPLKRRRFESRVGKALGNYERVLSEKWHRRITNKMTLNLVLPAALVAGFANMEALFQYFGKEPLVVLLGALGSVQLSLQLRKTVPPLDDEAIALSYLTKLGKP